MYAGASGLFLAVLSVCVNVPFFVLMYSTVSFILFIFSLNFAFSLLAYFSFSATVCAPFSFLLHWIWKIRCTFVVNGWIIDVDSFLLCLNFCTVNTMSISVSILLPSFSISWLWPLFLFWKLNQINILYFRSDQNRLILFNAMVGKIPHLWISGYFDVSPTTFIRLWSHTKLEICRNI